MALFGREPTDDEENASIFGDSQAAAQGPNSSGGGGANGSTMLWRTEILPAGTPARARSRAKASQTVTTWGAAPKAQRAMRL